VRLVRLSAFTVSSTRRTASLALGSATLRAASAEFDIGFLLGASFMAFGMPEFRLSRQTIAQNLRKHGQLDMVVFGMPKIFEHFFC
jgi:hypothetical protein